MKEKHTSKPSRTDWERVTTMKDEDIDYSDIPPLDANFFKETHVRWPEKKKQVTLRIDPDVIEFQKAGKRLPVHDQCRAAQVCGGARALKCYGVPLSGF